MNYDHFPYIYEQPTEDDINLDGVVETVLSFFAGIVCLVAVMMLWLCG